MIFNSYLRLHYTNYVPLFIYFQKIAPEKQTDPIEEYAEDIHSFHKLVEVDKIPSCCVLTEALISPIIVRYAHCC